MKRRTFLQALAALPALLLGGGERPLPPERILKVTGLAGWDGPEVTEDIDVSDSGLDTYEGFSHYGYRDGELVKLSSTRTWRRGGS